MRAYPATGGFGGADGGLHGVRTDEPDHADAHVEHAVGFLHGEAAELDQEIEDGGLKRDLRGVEDGVDGLRQDARDVVDEAAAGDVGDAVDRDARGLGGLDGGEIADVGLQEGFADGFAVEHVGLGIDAEAVGLEEEFPGEAESVGVETVGREADRDVAGGDVLAGDDLALLDDAGDDADEVEVVAVHAGHFRGLAAEHGAVRGAAGVGDAAEDVFVERAAELADADVVEEVDGLRALHGDVVDAVVHDIEADRVVLLHFRGDHELGADAVDAGDEDGFAVARETGLEESAEAADGGEHFGAAGGGETGLDAAEEFSCEVDVDAGFFVGGRSLHAAGVLSCCM